MLSFVTVSYVPLQTEVDYRGFNEAIRVTIVSYHQAEMQDASMINLSLSTTLTLYSPRKKIKHSKKSQT